VIAVLFAAASACGGSDFSPTDTQSPPDDPGGPPLRWEAEHDIVAVEEDRFVLFSSTAAADPLRVGFATELQSWGLDPAVEWSPNRDCFVFATIHAGPGPGVYEVCRRAPTARALPMNRLVEDDVVSESRVAWAPDGEHIAYLRGSRVVQIGGDLFLAGDLVIRASTNSAGLGDAVRLGNGEPAGYLSPTWAPDSDRVAALRILDGQATPEIVIYDVAASLTEPVLVIFEGWDHLNGELPRVLDWARTRDALLISADLPVRNAFTGNLWTVDLGPEGIEHVCLISGALERRVARASWSPDDGQIILTSGRGGWGLWIATLPASGCEGVVVEAFAGGSEARHPSWRR
jgi:hypothetical protein